MVGTVHLCLSSPLKATLRSSRIRNILETSTSQWKSVFVSVFFFFKWVYGAVFKLLWFNRLGWYYIHNATESHNDVAGAPEDSIETLVRDMLLEDKGLNLTYRNQNNIWGNFSDLNETWTLFFKKNEVCEVMWWWDKIKDNLNYE